ncbi:hypothetical protein CAFEA_00180 [Corynebacterium afermentans subsp. afermentans]|uniref:Secreted protein n=1 Tax=Corynebacterium afermentans TaxID=38286 RepID=A0A9X8WJD4_9CORY|nr:hypothetical protein [Corynebacterium afermentans]RUQ11877.1 hypothetical protein D8M31_08255 [Corynebacterium genitalium]MCG7273018.1 hypothetical protein [Corynebacterium afermentans]MDC7109373.1 hypothetical protein [Corynebacterium afermentans]OAA16071.1 hypothetical protein Caferm_04860 [Corynebacterium afermentans subsp. afermentans]WJY55675.1 hypothetical protein CAFEA_00180 [Corynebacterium afermentans subsp. afermentans]
MRASRIAGAAKAAIAAVAAVAIAGSGITATAQTFEESYPETPATNSALPIIHTYRGSDHLKANILNPRPVCNSTEDYRTIVYKVKDNFLPVGTISTTNLSDNAIPLSQDLSRTQTISASINGSKTETLSLGGSGSKKGIEGNIGYSLAKSLGWDVSGSLSWSVGQKIGPYDVPAGNTGEATYGFRTVTMTGTQQRCRPNGTWATPTAWVANMPVKNEVRVKNYSTPAGSWAPNKGAQVTDTVENPNPAYNEDVEKIETGANLDDVTAVDNDEATDVTNNDIANEGAEVIDEVEENAADEVNEVVDEQADAQRDLDLQPYFTASSWKVPGAAGSVALRLKNTGAKRYWGEFPALTFRVEVGTEAGPEGVDRLITTTQYNGTHIRDLGYDYDRGIRTFEVTLSNPILAGDEMLLGAFSFGDGNTKEGRLYNYMKVTQTGRLAGDTSFYNDQDVDSRDVTVSDFNKKIRGVF